MANLGALCKKRSSRKGTQLAVFAVTAALAAYNYGSSTEAVRQPAQDLAFAASVGGITKFVGMFIGSIIGTVVGIIVLVLFSLIVFGDQIMNKLRLFIMKNDESMLGIEIDIKKISLHVGRGKFEIKDVTVHNPPGWSSDYLLKMDRIVVDINTKMIFTSLAKSFEVQKVLVETVDVIYERRGSSDSNVNDLLTYLEAKGEMALAKSVEDQGTACTWFSFENSGADSGKDVSRMTAANLELCKAHCTQNGYGGFVVADGVAYFREDLGGHVYGRKVDADGCTLYVNVRGDTEGQSWHAYENMDADPGNDEFKLPSDNLELCKTFCDSHGFGGFVVCQGQAYFRSAPGQSLLACKQTARGSVLYINAAETDPQALKWERFTDCDSAPGEDAEQMPAGDSDACKEKCVSCGYGGFVVCNDIAYFRAKSGISLYQSKTSAQGSELYLLVPRQQEAAGAVEWKEFAEQDVDQGNDVESMPADDLEICKATCISKGYGGFVVGETGGVITKLRKIAYFRAAFGSHLMQRKTKGHANTTLYVALRKGEPDVPEKRKKQKQEKIKTDKKKGGVNVAIKQVDITGVGAKMAMNMLSGAGARFSVANIHYDDLSKELLGSGTSNLLSEVVKLLFKTILKSVSQSIAGK